MHYSVYSDILGQTNPSCNIREMELEGNANANLIIIAPISFKSKKKTKSLRVLGLLEQCCKYKD